MITFYKEEAGMAMHKDDAYRIPLPVVIGQLGTYDDITLCLEGHEMTLDADGPVPSSFVLYGERDV